MEGRLLGAGGQAGFCAAGGGTVDVVIACARLGAGSSHQRCGGTPAVVRVVLLVKAACFSL
jgi:hypothetical protein